MHTHLKGRIFKSQGASFLVLHEDEGSPEWIRVREVSGRQPATSMRVDEVAELLRLSEPVRPLSH